ncbi:copper chaperone PCu(A)C [Candidatus Blastococcus massiliensis]|uniref:copper chaperone PCu(A)C n=1 Tax=Candidatus Blastococcus massiliensis TaxID=1470358 RepID=UPI0004BB9610|nr:copper chaperone PCu(A)C [Candidatus Blastococcus massiliensis]
MNRALRAATLCVALLSPVALSACSAGQVTQTATQDRDRTGAMAQVGDITLRQVQVVNPRGGGSYDAGDDVDLRMAIVNTGREDDTLTSIEGEGFSSVEITGSETEAKNRGVSLGQLPVGSSGEIEVPAGTTLIIGEDDLTVTLTGLDEALTVGKYLTLVLTFENAGEITVQATVATPSRTIERAESFDFHHSEEASEGAEDIARERESDIGDED